jgi:hypothetical protein
LLVGEQAFELHFDIGQWLLQFEFEPDNSGPEPASSVIVERFWDELLWLLRVVNQELLVDRPGDFG